METRIAAFFPSVAPYDLIGRRSPIQIRTSIAAGYIETTDAVLFYCVSDPLTLPSLPCAERERARGFFEINEPRDSSLFALQAHPATTIERESPRLKC